MGLSGVSVSIRQGGLARRALSEDMICGLIMGAVAVGGTFDLETLYELNSVKAAEDLGINAAYDTTNDVLCHHHISEFFRMNPSGKLYIWGVAQGTTMTAMCDKAIANRAKEMLKQAGGKIQVLGVVLNPVAPYTPTLASGLDQDVTTAIPKAQALAAEELTEKKPVHIVLEGRSFNGTATAAGDLRATSPEATKVSVVIGADLDISDDSTLKNGYAAVGTLLGTISAAKVSENVGWPEKFPLQSPADSRFLKAGLSSNQALTAYTLADLGTLNDKGYIFPRSFVGLDGFYWNDGPTCGPAASDYAYIENNRTVNKAIRKVYQALVPKVNSPLKVDASTGKLSPEVAKSFEATALKALDVLIQDNDASGVDAYVDPDQDVLTTSTVQVEITIVPIGAARGISVSIGLETSL